MKKHQTYIVIPNWNGESLIAACLDSLIHQTVKASIVVVDNGSNDKSVEIIKKHPVKPELIQHGVNKGFSGGVNSGIKHAMKKGADFVLLFNNDAIAPTNMVELLQKALDEPLVGMATAKFVSRDGRYLDSTGDFYSTWGLSFPRGRGESDLNKYDDKRDVFGVSGGASIYKVVMLKQIGLFDEDFFAYYEDVDVSFRGQLAGWKARFVPEVVVKHHISATTSKFKGFSTYHTFKNLPLLYLKNMPRPLYWKYMFKFKTIYTLLFLSAVKNGKGWYALRGGCVALIMLIPKKIKERLAIQRSRKVTATYIDNILYHGIPPTAKKLRKAFPFARHEDCN
ncbi:glycosyltransferase family 2 protein [Candidatus Saccharibacteria bacterium CPR2]|nr:glycosyltransferase family 2 protein [Candidatus Saccharibacteria bacterium CPR2]